jgi:hypothetical protein
LARGDGELVAIALVSNGKGGVGVHIANL